MVTAGIYLFFLPLEVCVEVEAPSFLVGVGLLLSSNKRKFPYEHSVIDHSTAKKASDFAQGRVINGILVLSEVLASMPLGRSRGRQSFNLACADTSSRFPLSNQEKFSVGLGPPVTRRKY